MPNEKRPVYAGRFFIGQLISEQLFCVSGNDMIKRFVLPAGGVTGALNDGFHLFYCEICQKIVVEYTFKFFLSAAVQELNVECEQFDHGFGRRIFIGAFNLAQEGEFKAAFAVLLKRRYMGIFAALPKHGLHPDIPVWCVSRPASRHPAAP